MIASGSLDDCVATLERRYDVRLDTLNTTVGAVPEDATCDRIWVAQADLPNQHLLLSATANAAAIPLFIVDFAPGDGSLFPSEVIARPILDYSIESVDVAVREHIHVQ
ncbi:hypothetical protein CHELA1G11_40079 [Hyphomicrobiales bacterium]|nr:hypothetical protein CHELA1G2_40062 [Hyphomicrobiales bacterium]CAH1696487.1 hypothetical protein CHELA1G11_40079 [Hyphomicrobiales bacterium]